MRFKIFSSSSVSFSRVCLFIEEAFVAFGDGGHFAENRFVLFGGGSFVCFEAEVYGLDYLIVGEFSANISVGSGLDDYADS